jgi:hypothetical protein
VPFFELLPRVELTDLLIEADGWVGFSRHFVRAGRAPPVPGSTGPTSTRRCCPGHPGITAVADVAELSYRQLDWPPSPSRGSVSPADTPILQLGPGDVGPSQLCAIVGLGGLGYKADRRLP